MQVEVSQSWAGPYHAPGYTVSKLAPQDVKADPNADLYAAIPWAREVGLELIQDASGFHYAIGLWWFCADTRHWLDGNKRVPPGKCPCPQCFYPTRAAALKSPPPMPPGFTPNTTTDYPPDVLAACPQAREWGIRLETTRPGTQPFMWTNGAGLWWGVCAQKWHDDLNARRSGYHAKREDALANPPTTPPTGYVAAKPEEEIFGVTPKSSRTIEMKYVPASNPPMSEPSREEVEAGAIPLFWDDYEDGIANGISWETCANRDAYLERSRTVLEAAAKVRREGAEE